jgi:hypothetical protein
VGQDAARGALLAPPIHDASHAFAVRGSAPAESGAHERQLESSLTLRDTTNGCRVAGVLLGTGSCRPPWAGASNLIHRHDADIDSAHDESELPS